MLDVLSVVPIFVNVGAAALPAVVGAAASAAALVLRPRQLLRACRRRPVLTLIVLAGIAGAWAGGAMLLGGQGDASRPRRARAAQRTDWAKVALAIIRRRQGGPVPGWTPGGPADNGPTVLGRDFSRRSYDGGPVPLGLRLLWEHCQEDTMFLSSPAVTGGRVYGAFCQLDVTGKYGGVVCLEAATGKLVWQVSSIGGEDLKPFFSSPAVTADGRRLIIGQGLHTDRDCSLICLDAATGKLLWRVKTPLHIEGSPAIRGDVVVVGAGAVEGPDRRPVGDPGFVLAVRISDGKVLWRCRIADPESSPAIAADGTVYIGSGFNGSAVVALRPDSDDELRRRGLGRVLWRTGAPHPVTGAITLAGDLVIVGAGNGDYVFANPRPAGVVVALDRRTGKVRWQKAMADAVLGAVAAGGGKLICPVRNGEVVALDARDGKVLWRRRVSGRAPVLAGPAFAGRYVYAVSRDGYLAVIDGRDGKLVEKHYLNDEARPGELGLTLSSPTIAGGLVLVGSETGGLRCYVGGGAAPRAEGDRLATGS